jgi:thiol:disulfide interchange protein DsbD
VVCGEGVCVPGEKTFRSDVVISPVVPSNNSSSSNGLNHPQAFSLGILGAAFLGGLILNLMPCVFPVLGIKVMSFLKHSRDKKQAAGQGIVYALGIILSLCALGAAVIFLRSGSDLIGWGFQLQNPIFVWTMTAVLALISMNLAGGIEVCSFQWPSFYFFKDFFKKLFSLRWAQDKSRGEAQGGLGRIQPSHEATADYRPNLEGRPGRHSLGDGGGQGVGDIPHQFKAFASGILMVLVATPCSAPFLATALSGVFILPAWQAMLVMLAMGMGLSAPYLLLVAFPGALKFLPKPGAWMDNLKKILAWMMAASAVYLAWVYLGEVTPDVGLAGLFSLIFALFGLWIAVNFKKFGRAAGIIILAWVVWGVWSGIADTGCRGLKSHGYPPPPAGASLRDEGDGAVGPSNIPPSLREGQGMGEWDPEKVLQLRQAGRVVIVDFTARWCVNCLINGRAVWNNPEIQKLMREKNAAFLVADWTNRDDRIAAELRKFGRNAVPFALIYRPDEMSPRELPNLISVQQVREALR